MYNFFNIMLLDSLGRMVRKYVFQVRTTLINDEVRLRGRFLEIGRTG
jgi:hypothetical protein